MTTNPPFLRAALTEAVIPTLRDYQVEAVNAVRKALQAGSRAPLLVLPTGGGKTTIFSYVTASASKKSHCVYLLAHRAELVKQIAMTLARFGVQHRVVAPSKIKRQVQAEQFRAFGRSYVIDGARVLVCSAQTLVKRLDTPLPAPNLIVIDEAHHLTADSTWGKIVAHYPAAKLLPVTATPCRMDGKGLGVGAGGFADTIILGPTMRWLIENGYLSRYRIFAPPNALDLKGVRKRAGDYAKDQLEQAMDKPSITGDAVEHYLRLAAGKRAVVFCVSVAHAKHVAAEFAAAGVPSEFMDGSLDPDQRDATVKRFEAGTTLVMTSCDIVSEGFDLPAIEVAILLRPTQSTSLYLQQVGRALRIFPGKDCALILDHVGAVVTHGLPDEEREWTLDGLEKRQRGPQALDAPQIQLTTCPQCFAIHESAPHCPNCGHIYPARDRKVKQEEGELVELTGDQLEALRKRQARQQQGKAQTAADLVSLGYSAGQAAKIIDARQAKRSLQDDIASVMLEIRDRTGKGPYQLFGVTVSDLRKMKPKELKEIRGKVLAVLAGLEPVASNDNSVLEINNSQLLHNIA